MSLSKVDRLKILEQLANHFSSYSYPMIDAALEAFELIPLDEWNGDKHSYLIVIAKHASDEALLGLAEFAGITHSIPSPIPPQPSDRKFQKFRLFISHLSSNRIEAGEVSKSLRQFGFNSFVAHDDIQPTVEWFAEIERRLALCDGLIALLHDGFKESDWTSQEIGWVLGRRKPVISVRYENTPYGFFGKAQAFNGNGKTPDALAKEVFHRLAEHPDSAEAVSHSLVGYVAASTTFAQAKSRAEHLKSLKFWNNELRAKLKDAVAENDQISGSFGAPEIIAKVLKDNP